MPGTIGFIDTSDGANIRTMPAELVGSKCLTSAPLPPGTRVIVNGPHPQKREWSHVTTFLGDSLLSGYVQNLRINTALPEPAATLYHIKPGDRLEPIAARIYRQGIEPGHDLRFYQNVVLHVNQQAGRVGVQRLNGDVRLVEGHRIWLVSVAFAKKLQQVVPSGSITGGMLARARQAGPSLEDIIASVRESPQYFGSVAGEVADAIQQHLPEIIGIVLAFILAEALSAFLAATPTGVGQLAAAVIQLGLAAFGVQGMIEAGAQALKYAKEWLTQAWTARGNAKQIAEASKSFLRMLVSIAMAALAKAGIKSNFGRGLKLAQGVKITPPRIVFMTAAGNNGGAVAVPVFHPGSIVPKNPAAVAKPPTTSVAATTTKPATQGTKPATQVVNRMLDDLELEKLLQNTPNWEQLRRFVGCKVPNKGTLEFAALKAELEKIGYQLDAMSEGKPFRLRRMGEKAQAENAPLTVTNDGLILVKVQDGATRISVYSRYRKNYLDWLEETQGKSASEAASARITAGNQLHHLIPDGVAQSHPLAREALERLKGYTVDRGTNMIDMPGAPDAQGQLMHLGSHPNYSKYVADKLTQAQKALGPLRKVSPERLHKTLLNIENELRKAIQSGDLPDQVVKELLEDGIVVGKKLAMLEFRPWSESLTA